MEVCVSMLYARLVTKPSASIPSLGHSRKTTRPKSYCEEITSVSCSVTPYIGPTTGVLRNTELVTSIILRPQAVVTMRPTVKKMIRKTMTPMPGKSIG